MRRIISVAVVALVAVLFGAMLWLQPWAFRDGTPDDRLLAGMQFAASDAQEILDETGELPDRLPSFEGPGLSYQRLGDSSIRLCGVFEKASRGQQEARPYFDFIVGLTPEFTTARPNAGRHCYDVTLANMPSGVRADARAFRQLNAAATAVECAFMATDSLPATLGDAVRDSELRRDNPDCQHLGSVIDAGQAIEYVRTEAASIRLCADFSGGFARSSPPMRLFDPRNQSRFAELLEDRPEAGRRCYAIDVQRLERSTSALPPPWDEPIDIETLPTHLRPAATHDKRAIGDVVNVLRLARCAHTLEGAAPRTIEDAISVIAQSGLVARRFNCGWAPDYFAEPNNAPVATYQHLGGARVQVCAVFRASWEHPLALDYWPEALEDWPSSQPELQRPITEPGNQCFTLRLTAIGSGAP